MDKFTHAFINALETDNSDSLRGIPKSDLHNHSALGSRFADFQKWYGKQLDPPPSRMNSIQEMDEYLTKVLRPIFLTREGFEYALKAAFKQAKHDGVSVLEMSIDCWFIDKYPDHEYGLIKFIKEVQHEFASDIFFIPQLGLSRNVEIKVALKEARECIETGFFRSIDLYGEELIREPSEYKDLYKEAHKLGMRLKAHTGEFGNAESIRQTVETLELDEVQHGITAAQSPEIMRWLRENDIRLNVCPSSNIILGRVKSIKDHPIRVLVDNGLDVTINTDDLMLFGQGINDEYLNLYKEKTLTAEELDQIRIAGIEQKTFYI
jgi:adenosine deaminase